VFWGAYLSTADETLISGPLAEVADQITATKAELRARHGWIMDTYLLRRDLGGRSSTSALPGTTAS
jgi:precorrin-6A synthase